MKPVPSPHETCLSARPRTGRPYRINLVPALSGALLCGLLLATGGCATDARPSSEEPAASDAVDTNDVYAAPGGWPGGDGSLERPFDLGTALSSGSPARPGSTVWLRGGTYRGSFTGELNGTADAPIVVRPFPGELAVIDGGGSQNPGLVVRGSWAHYRDFEVMSSDPARKSNTGIVIHGANTKVINMVVHDFTGGIAIWRDAVDSEVYGNIIYYNGWFDASDQHPKGHGIYTQNELGTRWLNDNIIFSQFGAGIHAYGSSATYLDNMHFEGNIIFNNGILTESHTANILLGGGRVARAPVLKANYTYAWKIGDNNIGFDRGCEDLVMRDNYFVHYDWGFQLVNCSGTVEGNTVYGFVRAIEGQVEVQQPEMEKRYPNNRYLKRPTDGVAHFVRPNAYEPGRAHVIVYNWGKASRVAVDLSGAGVERGHRFQLFDVQNLSRGAIVSGTYSGATVTIPMGTLTETAPVVGHPTKPPHSAPEFGVFLLTSTPAEPSWFGSLWSSMFGLSVHPITH